MSQFVTDVASIRRACAARGVAVRRECHADMQRERRATAVLVRA
jgi:hypothetical protein